MEEKVRLRVFQTEKGLYTEGKAQVQRVADSAEIFKNNCFNPTSRETEFLLPVNNTINLGVAPTPPVLAPAAVTEYRKLGGLERTDIYFLQFRKLEVQGQGAAGLVSSAASLLGLQTATLCRLSPMHSCPGVSCLLMRTPVLLA